MAPIEHWDLFIAMTISLGISNKSTGAFRDIPICTNDRFWEIWQPAAAELGLHLIPLLPGLSLTTELRAQFIAEIDRLILWAKTKEDLQDYRSRMTETLHELRRTVASTDLSMNEMSFG